MKIAKTRQMMNGGMVRGRPGIDNNLVALTRGEAVLPQDTTRALGPENIRALIAATHTPVKAPPVKPLAGMVPAHADGYVDDPSGQRFSVFQRQRYAPSMATPFEKVSSAADLARPMGGDPMPFGASAGGQSLIAPNQPVVTPPTAPSAIQPAPMSSARPTSMTTGDWNRSVDNTKVSASGYPVLEPLVKAAANGMVPAYIDGTPGYGVEELRLNDPRIPPELTRRINNPILNDPNVQRRIAQSRRIGLQNIIDESQRAGSNLQSPQSRQSPQQAAQNPNNARPNGIPAWGAASALAALGGVGLKKAYDDQTNPAEREAFQQRMGVETPLGSVGADVADYLSRYGNFITAGVAGKIGDYVSDKIEGAQKPPSPVAPAPTQKPAPLRNNVSMRDAEDRSAGAVTSTDTSPVVAQVSGGGRSLALTADQMEKQYGAFKGDQAAADKMKAEYAAMKAQEAQDAQSAYNDRTRAMMDNINWAEAWQNKRDAQLGYYSHSGTANTPAGQAARNAGALADSAIRASETKPEMRDYLGEQEKQQANIDKSLLTAEGLRQSAAMAPLAQKAAMLKNALAQAGVDQAAVRKGLEDRMMDPKASDTDKSQAKEWLLALNGKTMHEVGRFRTRPIKNELGMDIGSVMYDSTNGKTVEPEQAKPSKEAVLSNIQRLIKEGKLSKDEARKQFTAAGYSANDFNL